MIDLRTRLTRIASNLWWSWNPELDAIFRSIDVQLWRRVNHNPIAFLKDVEPELLAAKEADAHLVAQTIRVEKALQDYLADRHHWASWNAPGLAAFPVAYFSPEFGLHESLPIYSGGLGVLAGDHLKSCSDLGIRAYGVTLLYRQGYFAQQIDGGNHQSEVYRELDTSRVPLERARDAAGNEVNVTIPMGEEALVADVWEMHVGRCRLLLLDPHEASGAASAYAPRLYGGDRTTRIVQELVLGVGGYRALQALGIRPRAIHLNEGHSGFALLEAIAATMEATGQSFEKAASEVSESVVFTTHTPVEAGHDRFEPSLVLRLLASLQQRLGLSDDALLGLGRVDPSNASEEFCMTVLALKIARRTNGVSSLHGWVSRHMWQGLWPDRRPSDVPIGHITNGAHVDTWLATGLAQLYGDCLGPEWKARLTDGQRWQQIEKLDELQLWSLKLALKRRLLDFIRRRLKARQERLGLEERLPVLRTDALTIGFARRFASYKRGLLLFEDFERTKRLLTDPERPVQVIFSGKSHPADGIGKGILQQLVEISQMPELRDHVVVIENHDMNVSRHLLEGCDLWLNGPRRPLEACGTSGMKAAFNATLNCSTLDGWWDEAYDGANGFAYGDGLVHVDPAVQDRRDAVSLVEVLEQQVVPLYYRRNGKGIPSDWLARVKHALRTLMWRYNSDRMVMDYARSMYLSASRGLTAEIIE